MYAEIILPLPLYSTFTYEIPEEMRHDLCKGSRVLVQFGKKKYYTGIVEHIHSQAPAGYDVKQIMALLDPTPVVRYPQLKLLALDCRVLPVFSGRGVQGGCSHRTKAGKRNICKSEQ